MAWSRQGLCIGTLCAAVLAAATWVSGRPALAQQTQAPGTTDALATHAIAYADCMSQARRAPEKALTIANRWEREGGDEGARHCRAVALMNTGAYAEAARQLESLAATTNRPGKRLKGELLAQAGQAWLVAGRTESALSAQTRALALVGPELELLLDRAITLASAGAYWKAIDDLNDAIDQDSRHAGALVFRATAWRKLKNLDLARDDIERAIAVSPDRADALLERGNIRSLRGDKGGAVADWEAVIAGHPTSPAADAARENLEKLKVN
jgi:tetratricopeptide (TPR) repeat protein